ncbi:MAG: YolD-like family protein [Bacilli bacterium]|nr:YolD-like family protein [Bacilli bacterium]
MQNNYHDRTYIKWAPFNSLINDKKIINEINEKNKKVDKPILSDDQIELLNEKIFDAYTNHYKVNITIYKNQNIINLNGFINNININKKCITFNNSYIFFNQILKIY